jgi:hypothetical protein
MTSRYLILLAATTCVACSQSLNETAATVTSGDSVTMSATAGPVIARDSLTAVDRSALPCCATDSAGVHVQVTGGTLTFSAASSYAEMIITPEGPRPNACVQGVPNGSHLDRNELLTLLDGESYLLLPCTAGYFSATLTEQLDLPDGSSTTRQVTLATGRYGWQRNLLSLREQGTASGATAAMSGATITVAVPGHRYAFVALPR